MQSLESCLTTENGTTFKRTEKKKTFELSCSTDIECQIYGIDDCVFAGEQIRRCDWLFVVPKNREKNSHLEIQSRAYYVELKGEADHSGACEQLYNAICHTRGSFPNFELHARIVSPKGVQPELYNNEYYKKVKKLIKRDILVGKAHKGNYNKYTESI